MTEEATIDDAVESFEQTDTDICEKVTYTRTFSNTEWQALYVPFAMKYSEWKDDYEVADINNMNQYDTDDDGVADITAMEIIKIKSGTLEPNTPYLIRAKEAGEKSISLNCATLYQTEETSFDVTSRKLKFEFTGTYQQIPGSTMVSNGYYAMGNGSLHQAADANANLGAFRWYMKVTDRNGSPQKLGAVRIMEQGDDVTDLTIATLLPTELDHDATYSLTGAKLNSPAKGLQIKNGKLVFMR